MNGRRYMMFTGTLIGLIGIGHLIRVIVGWQVIVGPITAPMWVSGVAAVACCMVGLWGWVEAGKLTAK